MASLATIAQVEARLARDLTGADETRMQALLDDASAAVRGYTGQEFTSSSTTLRLKARTGVLRLPQRPVTAVASVEDTDGNALSYEWMGDDRIYLWSLSPLNAWEINISRTRLLYVDITYTHGYAAVPDDIVAVVCQMASRAYGISPTDSGRQSESIQGYSYSVGGAAASGGVGMLNDERAVLDRYRRPGSSAILAS